MSSRNRIYAFQRILLADGHIVTVRKTRGDDIDAACGQLAGQVADKTKRSARYIQLQDVHFLIHMMQLIKNGMDGPNQRIGHVFT